MSIIRKYPRSSGVLMPLTSLNGPFGIGVLGQEATEFIDFLHNAGFHAWQILPVTHTGTCNSPYKSISTFAGEPMLIDPRMLLDMNLVTEEELYKRQENTNDVSVEYDIVRQSQWELLRAAFSRLSDDEYKAFDPFWLDEYSLYMTIYLQSEYHPWYDWKDEALRSHNEDALRTFRKEHQEELLFHRFVQWVFDKQWRSLKAYASERGISLIGDMPIYVSEGSVDVWSRRELFNADANGNFAAISGVPPDYFTPDGQFWGNPIYNWELLKDENYGWWVNRLRFMLDRYDVVRFDHFRAFSDYWRIPGSSDTARDGKWVKGPGMLLFKALRKKLGDLTLSVIAEDLGIIDDEVEKLLEQTGLRGMRVLQFGFLGDDLHLPHNIPEETVVYTGTHDNTTLLAYLFALDPEDRRKVLFYTGISDDWYIGGPNCESARAWVRMMFKTASSLAIVPIQDLLGYGSDTRINIPGTSTGNWRFRIREGVLRDIDVNFYRELHKAYQREDFVKAFAEVPEKEKEEDGY